MKALRKRLLELDPTLETYAASTPAWRWRRSGPSAPGSGWIGKNGLLINTELGSWLTLSVMFVDREVDVYDSRTSRLCGACTLCLGACPTGAFAAPGVVDSRRCIAYQSIENRGAGPGELRPAFEERVFGCDVCQEVCPWNHRELPDGRRAVSAAAAGGARRPRRSPRSRPPTSSAWPPGWRVARAQYDGLRRNALYAIGAAPERVDRAARAVVERLADDPAPVVRDAARWAREQLDGEGSIRERQAGASNALSRHLSEGSLTAQ